MRKKGGPVHLSNSFPHKTLFQTQTGLISSTLSSLQFWLPWLSTFPSSWRLNSYSDRTATVRFKQFYTKESAEFCNTSFIFLLQYAKFTISTTYMNHSLNLIFNYVEFSLRVEISGAEVWSILPYKRVSLFVIPSSLELGHFFLLVWISFR